MEKLDLDFIRNHVSDVQEFLEICPNPTTIDLGKMLSIQGAVLQREGLILLQEAAGEVFHKKIRRLGIAVDLLSRAESAFSRADVILRRHEAKVDSERAAIELLEARRIANDELLARAREEGLVVSVGANGKVTCRPPTRKELFLQ